MTSRHGSGDDNGITRAGLYLRCWYFQRSCLRMGVLPHVGLGTHV